MSDPVTAATANRLNIWTVGAISIVAYAMGFFLHEGVGHGGACLLIGARPLSLNAIFFNYDFRTASPVAVRIIAAGGCVVNFATALISLALLQAVPSRAASFRYFLWLLSAVNLLLAFGYFLFSGVIGIGDWASVTQGLGPPFVTRGALILIGGVLYLVVAPKMLVRPAQQFFDRDADLRAQVKRLMRVPYFVGGTTAVSAALFNPQGLKLLLISAVAASFGGTSLLAWYPFERDVASADPAAKFVLPRSIPWIAAAAVTAALFIGVLGPGVRF